MLAELGIRGGVRQRKAVMSHTDARFMLPCKTAELRVMDLDESITEIAKAIAAASSCSPSDIKVGEICKTATRLATDWVQGLLTVVYQVAAAKRVQVGWISARVEVLAQRPLQCFQWLEMGHVKAKCPGHTYRSGRYFRRGKLGHKARDCVADAPKCPDHQRWFGAVDGSAAICWPGGEGLHCSLLRKAEGLVAVEWGVTVVVGCYFSSNRGLADYEACTGWRFAYAITLPAR